MTQTVFSNSMVAHVWAQQRQQNGRSNNGNFYFEGRVLYSYGTHFPVGIFADDRTVFLNADSYSVSTSGHQADARSAVRHISRVCYLPSLASVQRLILSADSNGRIETRQRKPALAYLATHWQRISDDSDGAAWLLRAIRSKATWPAMRARLSAKADALAARNKARLKTSNAKAGRDLASRPWPIVRAAGNAKSAQANPFDPMETRNGAPLDSGARQGRFGQAWQSGQPDQGARCPRPPSPLQGWRYRSCPRL